jgi:diguanylate cyclase
MSPILVDLLSILFSGLAGAAVASWLWYSHSRRKSAAASRECPPAAAVGDQTPPAAGVEDRLQRLAAQMAVDFATRLHELVTQAAFDVGEHSSRVQEINRELESSPSQESTKVLDVVVKLVEANQQMQDKLARTEQKLHEQRDQMQTLLTETRTDALTLLANRRAFDDELSKRAAEFRRQGRSFALTIVDVDHFKDFNDVYGHRAGDEVLRSVAKLLRRKMRETDMVARYGGEEFAIIHPGTSVVEACASALRACEAIEKNSFVYEGNNLHVTVSLGLAEILSNETANDMLKRADSAMYAAKEAGRNCVYLHDGKDFRRVVAGQDPLGPQGEIPLQDQSVPASIQEEEPARPVEEAPSENLAEAAAAPETPLDLLGRTYFCQQVRSRMAEWQRGGPAFSVALIEVCQSGPRGEIRPRQTKETMSRLATTYLLATVREMDVLGSYTPDCFALMMPTAGLVDAIRVVERLSEQLLEHIFLEAGKQSVFALSVGVVQAIQIDDATSLLKRAEMALDAAERKGGNRVYCHDGQRIAPVAAILELESAGYPA